MSERQVRVGSPSVAAGRLGSICTAFLTETSQLGAVEVVPVENNAEWVHTVLDDELQRVRGQLRHPHVFCYDAVQVASDQSVQLIAHQSVSMSLLSVIRSFTRLHPLVVRTYMRSIISGIEALNQHKLTADGLSLASVFLSEGRIQVAGWFPPVSCLRKLQEQHVLDTNQLALSVLRRGTSTSSSARDIRSVAYVLVEMITGLPVRGARMDDDTLIQQLDPTSLEHAFLLELLQPSTSFKSLRTHPYLQGNAVSALSPNPSTDIVLPLVEKELGRCQELHRQYTRELRAWTSQFEKRYQRKPRRDERPPGMQRAQVRCRTIHTRIQELQRHQRLLAPENGEEGNHAAEEEVHEMKLAPLPILNVPERDENSSDARRRSPAQNAFLDRLSDPNKGSFQDEDSVDESIVASRERAHKLLHQRKDVMEVISGLEQQ
ncbi:hypothetical protein Poli38472_012830 [Pythium oligandrum]|uniref:Protein kinase domain-containing protein n=1 Tax=Pythium oligandrum TaxID=41045 RepID=A0A8K1CKV1_PYTOL|nr:hypothetical protein Poli38472_012830 [Pythium oligandrum]|eukprot:TMW64208.1 hypothetical protein Poli38472_012830 [Pythium oligandrum]